MFSENIKKLRESAGLTQDEFAEKIFVTRTAVSKWENGKSYPSIDSLKEISALFGVSIDSIISDDEFQHFRGFESEKVSSKGKLSTKNHIKIIIHDLNLISKSDWVKCLIIGMFAIPFITKLFLGDNITYLQTFVKKPLYFIAIMLAAIKVVQLKIQVELKAPAVSASAFAILLMTVYYGFLFVLSL